jgi:hypothetical protein
MHYLALGDSLTDKPYRRERSRSSRTVAAMSSVLTLSFTPGTSKGTTLTLERETSEIPRHCAFESQQPLRNRGLVLVEIAEQGDAHRSGQRDQRVTVIGVIDADAQ